MKLIFYDSFLNKKLVELSWLSLLWDTMYNDVGSFVAEFQAKTEISNFVSIGDYIVFDEDESQTVMIVWGIEAKGNKIIISGNSAISIFDNRISQEIIRNQNAEVAMHELVTNMTPWDCIENGEIKGIADNYVPQISDDTILNYCLKISQYCDIGFRLKKSNNKLLFECYKPQLNSSIVFDAKFGNINNERFSENNKEFRNVAIVAGAVNETTGERISVIAGDMTATGAGRREIYVDARDIQPAENETSEQYEERLKERGEEKLAECSKTSLLDFSLISDDVKLGDLVIIKPSYLNIATEARVQYITYKSQNNTIKKTIGIGQLKPRKRGK